ncbi:uncharacterized protein LOC108910570 [Anoplophora glabripennis]|uniref:uncharacterized protein LOC108910570 n=1 Tax=Anoplophora glabripennis TaxID=217634 RepID=UPI0008740690|nr:uncharacterized protein LOC108910570 [Anoplophora glabripennis]
MAEGTYEYECMRAELLGIEKPDYEEFMKKIEGERKAVEEENLDTENLKEADLQEESEKRIMGGLEELNSLLQKTQVKINRFKASCGSLTNLLKIKVAGKPDSSSTPDNSTPEPTGNTDVPTNESAPTESITNDNDAEKNEMQRKSDLAKALDKDLSTLDSMIEKAESAQYSMEHQRKQMKKFLN